MVGAFPAGRGGANCGLKRRGKGEAQKKPSIHPLTVVTVVVIACAVVKKETSSRTLCIVDR